MDNPERAPAREIVVRNCALAVERYTFKVIYRDTGPHLIVFDCIERPVLCIDLFPEALEMLARVAAEDRKRQGRDRPAWFAARKRSGGGS